MSNYLRSNDDAVRQTTSAAGRRKLWLATGVLGLTGAVSLTGVAYGGGVNGLADLKWSTAQQLNNDDKRNEEGRDWHEGQGPGAGNWNEKAWGDEQAWDDKGRGEHGKDDKGKGEHGKDDEGKGEHGKDDKGKGEDGDRVREVDCDEEDLVEAIDLLNRG
ncbi:hypothetical protein KBX63_34860, partial [Micromonospora sp. U21]|nr:hypothetical protein [Micromonospora sp. U21]